MLFMSVSASTSMSLSMSIFISIGYPCSHVPMPKALNTSSIDHPSTLSPCLVLYRPAPTYPILSCPVPCPEHEMQSNNARRRPTDKDGRCTFLRFILQGGPLRLEQTTTSRHRPSTHPPQSDRHHEPDAYAWHDEYSRR
ncbi:hypothetical protein B0J11DRAFT_92385 [Dendryphion nanum]|uniref:Uncharacterized protein n=1 Tax=Dendryphion nanum TaxID=256645 RepID=A0A9P9DE92_9PLEO|nr:hypothetical protein B0J11DRAFT_92385 [Dendryphion nanum]